MPLPQPGAARRSRFVANMPLGVDLKHERKKDPSLILFFMRTKVDVTGDSKEYNQLQKASRQASQLPWCPAPPFLPGGLRGVELGRLPLASLGRRRRQLSRP